MMPYPYPVVPETITCDLGAPGESARNVVVPFAQYIKNVASHEIYPTWPESAIRANILAQISYALNRVYTEYYRARGYDFDITSTTRYDQAYVEDGDIFENISRIVDDIFNNYIVRQGSVEPLFAQFCDGVRTRCGGLSQWGSVDLAEEGMTPYEILQYYYGGDINLVMNAPVGGNVASYPGRPLRRGDAGNDVQTLKRQLNRIGKNYPAIPALDDSFVFDEDMEEAVRVFQQIFNLAQDGIVGKATWYKIKQIYNGVKQLSDLSSEGLTIPEVQRRYAEDLRLGDSGIDVRTVRFYLAFLGYFLPELPMISLSDDFDQELLDAVYTFQRVYGLPVDGVVGRETVERPANGLSEGTGGTAGGLPAVRRGGLSGAVSGAGRPGRTGGPDAGAAQPDQPGGRDSAQSGGGRYLRPRHSAGGADPPAAAGLRPHRGRGAGAVGADHYAGRGVLKNGRKGQRPFLPFFYVFSAG